MDTKRFPESEKTAALAVMVNGGLSLGKFLLAFLSGSVALLAEAIHSLTDVGTSGAVFWATRTESRDHKDPKETTDFWKNNLQRKVSIFIGLFLFVLSISIFFKVFTSQPIRVRYPALAATGMVLAAMFSWLLARLENTTGKKEGATALLADSHHAKVDMYGSFLVAVALFGEGLELNLDRPAAGIISLLVFVQACQVFRGVFGEKPESQENKAGNKKENRQEFPEGVCMKQESDIPAPEKKSPLRTFHLPALWEGGIKNWRKRFPGWCLRLIPVLVSFYLFSGIYVVNPNQKAVVERFGKPRVHLGTIGPGLHYLIPWPVDRVRLVDAMRVRRLVIGSEVSPKTAMALWTNKHYIREFNLLTGENIFVDTSVVVNYTVSSVLDFVYQTTAPEKLLEKICYSVLLREMAGSRFFRMVTTERDTLEQRLTEGIQKAIDRLHLGLRVRSVDLRDVHPPTRVAQDFEEVVGAAVDYETFINEARGYRNGLIPQARAEGLAMKGKAQARSRELVLKSRGDIRRFTSHLKEYQKAPGFHRYRYLMEAAETYFPRLEKVFVPPNGGAGAVELVVFEKTPQGKEQADDPVGKKEN